LGAPLSQALGGHETETGSVFQQFDGTYPDGPHLILLKHRTLPGNTAMPNLRCELRQEELPRSVYGYAVVSGMIGYRYGK
jgi:hypothetical protein